MGIKNFIIRSFRYIFKGIPVRKTTIKVVISSPTNILNGRAVLITGGGKGLGFAFAKKCIEEGAKVVITGRNEKTLRDACSLLGSNSYYIVKDVSTNFEDNLFFEDAEKMIGQKIDSLISNAGISLHEGDFRKVTEKTWDAQMNTNLKGNYFLVQQFIRYLESKEDKKGNVVVITSERAMRSDDIPYGLTKVASNSFIKCIASKVAAEGIRINGVGPGVTSTDMTGVGRDGNMYNSWQSSERFFLPEEISEVVNFLLSDFSGCISGEIITCDLASYVSHW